MQINAYDLKIILLHDPLISLIKNLDIKVKDKLWVYDIQHYHPLLQRSQEYI